MLSVTMIKKCLSGGVEGADSLGSKPGSLPIVCVLPGAVHQITHHTAH